MHSQESSSMSLGTTSTSTQWLNGFGGSLPSDTFAENLRSAQVFYQGKNILVTGTNGFIGGVLARRLATLGAFVIKADSVYFKGPSDAYDVVFHLGAHNQEKSTKDPATGLHRNVIDTELRLRLSGRAKVKRFVFTSSVSIYGDDTIAFTEDSPHVPINPYAIGKSAGEMLCAHETMKSGLETVILRLSNVYGPGMKYDSPYCGIIGKAIASVLRGVPFGLTDKQAARTYTYIDDVINALLIAGASKDIDDLYNIAGDHAIDNLSMMSFIRTQMPSLYWEVAPKRAIDTVSVRLVDNNKAKADGLLPKTCAWIHDGLRRTVKDARQWFLYSRPGRVVQVDGPLNETSWTRSV